jgi:hypothetical protein
MLRKTILTSTHITRRLRRRRKKKRIFGELPAPQAGCPRAPGRGHGPLHSHFLCFWQGEFAGLQAFDEGGTAQVRRDPGAEALLKLPGLFELVGGIT